MADSAPLIINRRVVIRVGLDGTRKIALTDGTVDGDCGCCDTEVCGSPCDSGDAFDGIPPNTPVTCCIPQTLQVSISAVSPGPCSSAQVEATTTYAHVTPKGRLSFTACLTYSGEHFDENDNHIISWGSNLIEVSGVSLKYIYNASPTDCDNHLAGFLGSDDHILKIERVAVVAYFVSRPDSNVGVIVHVVAVCGRAYELDGTTRRPANDIPIASTPLLFASGPESWIGTGNARRAVYPAYTLCSEETMTVSGKTIEDYTYTTDAGSYWPPTWVDGTAKIKKCCEEQEDVPCPGSEPPTFIWYQAIKCLDNTPIDYVWAREDWLHFTGDTSEAYFHPLVTACIYFHKTLSVKRTVPPDAQPEAWKWLYSDLIVYPDCAACADVAGAYLQARDCAGDALLNFYVTNDTDVLTDGTAYQLPGTCIYFNPSDSLDEEDLPDDAEIYDINDFTDTQPDCETCAGSTPCPEDNAACGDSFVGTFTPAGDCIGVTAKSGTLAPLGDGTWEYCQYPDTDPGPGCLTSMKIICSGRYYVAIVSDAVEEAGYNVQFRKLRTGDCPPTGEYEFVSSSLSGCSVEDSTFTLA